MNTEDAHSWAVDHIADNPPFDIERFTALKAFAYRTDGLDLSVGDAHSWAVDHIADNPPFDFERFTALKTFAYRTDGLDMSIEDAHDWALSQKDRRNTMD